MELISLADVHAATSRIRPHALRTPLVACSGTSAPLWLKPENLQPVGAFKIRGALNALARLNNAAREAGVVTHSSGNHGQALAYAARAEGIACVVVVPEGASQVKVAAMRRFGAEIVTADPAEREATALRLVGERGLTLVPPFDDRDIIAGQGTVGEEICAELAEPQAYTVLVPVGGGGLASGVATAVRELSPRTRVVGVEPELAADAAESLETGRLTSWPPERTQRTIADGTRVGLSELTLAHLRERLDEIVTVTDDEIRSAMGGIVRGARIVAEPSGALATAAVLSGRIPTDTPAVAVVSGGNVDPDLLARVVAEGR